MWKTKSVLPLYSFRLHPIYIPCIFLLPFRDLIVTSIPSRRVFKWRRVNWEKSYITRNPQILMSLFNFLSKRTTCTQDVWPVFVALWEQHSSNLSALFSVQKVILFTYTEIIRALFALFILYWQTCKTATFSAKIHVCMCWTTSMCHFVKLCNHSNKAVSRRQLKGSFRPVW